VRWGDGALSRCALSACALSVGALLPAAAGVAFAGAAFVRAASGAGGAIVVASRQNHRAIAATNSRTATTKPVRMANSSCRLRLSPAAARASIVERSLWCAP
jgi:hypothetical protein